MHTTTVVPVGAYLVRPGFAAIRDAFRCHGIQDEVRRELRSIVLLELEVNGAHGPLGLEHWHQEGSSMAPYAETYFTLDRSRQLAQTYESPQVPDYAVAFYLHFYNPAARLLTPYGVLTPPTPVWRRPPHLAALRYSYWD